MGEKFRNQLAHINFTQKPSRDALEYQSNLIDLIEIGLHTILSSATGIVAILPTNLPYLSPNMLPT